MLAAGNSHRFNTNKLLYDEWDANVPRHVLGQLNTECKNHLEESIRCGLR